MSEVTSKRTFRMMVTRHLPTGWLFAAGEGLPELLVHGKDVAQICKRTPSVLRRLLERRGVKVEAIHMQSSAPQGVSPDATRLTAIAAIYPPA